MNQKTENNSSNSEPKQTPEKPQTEPIPQKETVEETALPKKKRITTSSLIDKIIQDRNFKSPSQATEAWQSILAELQRRFKRKASRTLVRKRVKKLALKGLWEKGIPSGEPTLPPAQRPLFKIEEPKPPPKEEEKPPEEEKPSTPSLEPAKKEEAKEELAKELTDEEIEKLRPILIRSVKRTFSVFTEALMKLSEKAGLTEQEADDSVVLLEIAMCKYVSPDALGKYYFETTAVMHFGSIAGRAILEWREKKAREEEETQKLIEKEKRKEEEARKKVEEEEARKKSEQKPEPPQPPKDKDYWKTHPPTAMRQTTPTEETESQTTSKESD